MIYDDRLYNDKVKQEYLAAHNKGTRSILERLFKIACHFEADLNKDIYDFNREELRKLFFTFMPSTENASKSTVLYISRYIDWAIEEGYLEGMNPLDSTDTAWKRQFAVKPDKFYWTDKDMHRVLKKLVNAQDALVLYAPFIGILGYENAEITNLKQSHIDPDLLKAHVLDADGSWREVDVDEEFVRLANQAMEQEEYMKRNGQPKVEIRSEAAKLVDNDFIVRSSQTRVKHTEEADKNIVYRRYAVIKQQFDAPYLTPTFVLYSGMLHKAKNYYIENRLHEGFEKIKQQFNVSEATLKRYKEEFLNEGEIIKLYGLSKPESDY